MSNTVMQESECIAAHTVQDYLQTIIHVIDITGTSQCVDAKDGEKVFRKVNELLQDGQKVTLSFDGVKFVISAFLNSAIGKLCEFFTEDRIRDQLNIEALNPEDHYKLDRVIKNGVAYYRDKQTVLKVFNRNLGMSGE